MKKYSEEIKKKVIEELLSGHKLLEEVVREYHILSKQTVKKWMKDHQKRKITE